MHPYHLSSFVRAPVQVVLHNHKRSGRITLMSSTTTREPLALGIRRISDDAGRAARGKLHADKIQDETIERLAAANGAKLLDILDETNVSGGTPLEQRPYGRAIERVESGEIQAVIFAYRTRHDRDVLEGSKAIERMDRAGGVLIVGGEVLTHATPDQWFQATMGSVMGELQKRQITWASHKGVAKAVALGRVPYPAVPLGLVLNPDNTVRLVDDERVLDVVRKAFAMRASGTTIDAVRAYLASSGHVRAYRAIQRMLHSPLYVGEIRFGVHSNVFPNGPDSPGYFPAIVERDVWDKVQTMSVKAGRYAKSERLLARQDVLHCGGCGGRMIVGTNTSPNGKTNTFYRCGRGRTSDCPARATIHAERVEQLVSDQAREILCDAEERETAVREAVESREQADAAERKFKRARKLLVDDDTVEDDEAQQQLDELRADWQSKLTLADQLEDDCDEAELVNAARDWHRLTLDERRRLIKASIRSVSVRPGRDGDVAARCTIEPKRKQTSRRAA